MRLFDNRKVVKFSEVKIGETYITGDVSYHDFLTEKGFFIMDIGHYEGEIDIVRKISDLLKEKIPTFAVRLITENNNLVHYI